MLACGATEAGEGRPLQVRRVKAGGFLKRFREALAQQGG